MSICPNCGLPMVEEDFGCTSIEICYYCGFSEELVESEEEE